MRLIHYLSSLCGSLLIATTAWATVAPVTIERDKGNQQLVAGFVLGGVVAFALHNYYSYYQQCPTTIDTLNLPDISDFTNSPLASVAVDKNCTLTLHYKNDPTIAEGVRGKTLTIEKAMTSGIDEQSFTGKCYFNGDTSYAPSEDCQLTKAQQQVFTPQLLAWGAEFSKLYNKKGAIPTLTAPMSEAVLLAFEQKKYLINYYNKHAQCPANNQALGILPATKINGAFVESVTIEGCDIVATLNNQTNLFPALRGKSLILRMLPTTQKGIFNWQCGSNAEAKFLPKQCQ